MNPFQILKAGIRAVPAVRYALAVAGMAATLAIVASFRLDWRVAVIGGLVVLIFMVAMVAFSGLTKLGSEAIKGPATFLLWAFVMLTVLSAYLFASSVFFEWPLPLSEWIKPKASPNNPQKTAADIDTQGLRIVRKTESESVYTYWDLPKGDRVLREDSELRFELPTELQTVIRSTTSSPKIAELRGHGSDVRIVAFNPKGKIVATGGEDRRVVLWDLEHWKCLGSISGFEGTIRALAFSVDGKSLAIAGESSSIFVLDTEHYQSSKRFLTMEDSSRINCLAFSQDGKMLAAAGSGRTYFWNTSDNQKSVQYERLRSQPSYAYGVAFSANGPVAVGFHGGDTSDVSEFVRFWRSASNQSSLDLVGNNDRMINLTHEDVIGGLQFSSDGHLLARATRAQGSFNRSAGAGGSLLIWDLNQQLERSAYSLPYGNYYSLCFYADTNVFVVTARGKADSNRQIRTDSASGSRFICVWDSLSKKSLAFETDHESGVATCALSQDLRFLATSGIDSSKVCIWQIKQLREEASIQTEANANRLVRTIETALKDATSRFPEGEQDEWRNWLKVTLQLNPDIHSIRELKALRWSVKTPSISFLLNSLDEKSDDDHEPPP